MKYLITGATGFVGSHLARALSEQGCIVRAFLRETSDLSPLRGLKLDLAYGDIRDATTVRQALQGTDVVFHCAGAVGDWGPFSSFYQTNVLGTRNLLEASRDLDIQRVIVVSSLSIYGIKHHEGTTEEAPFRKTGDSYSDSKIATEKMMMEFLDQGKPPLTIIRPGFIYGPGDRKFVPKLLEALHHGRFLFIGDGNNILNIVYIDDVIQALLLAANNPEAIGRAYNITDGTRTTARQFVSALATFAGLEVPTRHIPFKVAYVACVLSETMARLVSRHRRPQLTRAALKLLGYSRYFDITRAREELGYVPRVEYREGLGLTLRGLERESAPGRMAGVHSTVG